ncbi:AAA family ATPase [Rhodococcus sp. JVH1]|uniref:AAA family ATPase n=1 Tax=Rhodococcus sp. JVH1 TaxID=745408 RepID=UPI0002721D03|nr:AAA family ATPase [Rhodococcus sp. JVH1]EJI96890.1 hypothetical protein JVH1_5612 [Rhodococcus sp. JVH1]
MDFSNVNAPPPNDEPSPFPKLDWHRAFQAQPVEIPWLIEDLFIIGRSYAMVAAAKAGKSLLMLDLCAALSSGRTALGRAKREPISVLYVDLENTEQDVIERLLEMNYGPDDLANLHYLSFPSMEALDTRTGGQQLAEVARYWDAQLIVIDTLSRVVEGDENSSDTYRNLYRCALAPLKAERRTIVRLDHLGKDATKGVRGSSAKNDDVDAVWLLTQKSEDVVTLRRERQRSNHHPEFIEVRREDSPLRHVAAAGTDKPELAKLLADMDRLGIPPEMGRTTARAILSNNGITAKTKLLAEAIKHRKAVPDSQPMSLLEDSA